MGFKAANQGNLLDLALGYSHNIIIEVPKELKVSTAQEKGQTRPLHWKASINNYLARYVLK